MEDVRPLDRREAAAGPNRFKLFATWGLVLGTAVWTMFFFGYLVVSMTLPDLIPESWFLSMLKERPSATLGIAMASISAFSVVAVLDVLSRDPIEIKFLGFELKGAAGPVVLWVVCFFAVVLAMQALWSNPGIGRG